MTPTLEHIEAWASELESLHRRLAARFVRLEPRRRALAYLQGLLSPIDRKNGWQLAERAGELTPDGMQRLLASASWDEAGVRDDLRAYVLDNLHAEDAVLVVDETGFLKKGEHSVGVKRQYSGTKGGIDNCQVGVFLAYASAKGTAFIDRELFLPQEWAVDASRRREARVPDEIEFLTKPQLATRMLTRALDAGVKPAWVVGDSIYSASSLRRELERRQQPYVLAVTSGALVRYWDGYGLALEPVAKVFAGLPKRAWRRHSTGAGSKGERDYDWAWLRPAGLGESQKALALAEQAGFDNWFLARRNRKDHEITYYCQAMSRSTS